MISRLVAGVPPRRAFCGEQYIPGRNSPCTGPGQDVNEGFSGGSLELLVDSLDMLPFQASEHGSHVLSGAGPLAG